MENFNFLIKISEIIAKEKIGEISEEEKKMLQNWLQQNRKNEALYKKLKKEDNDIIEEMRSQKKYNTKKAYKKVKIIMKPIRKARTITLIPNLYKYAAAFIILVIGLYFVNLYFNKLYNKQIALEQIKPGTQKAILTTADNQKIELGKTNKKSIFRIRKATIIDTSSTLTYQVEKSIDEKIIEQEFNQLETPRGGEYTLVLDDDSKIKLNSASMLKFPVTFNNTKREVELKGEAYFEIAKSEIPFYVKVNGMRVKVYGTSFNISGYTEDNFIQTTLVEGKVGIEVIHENKTTEYAMVPGEQANYEKNTSIVELKKVNTDVYTAWTKGMFVFDKEPLELILNKLKRWYNVEFEYANENIKNEAFTGDLKRYEDFSKILEMISMASNIEFEIDNNKIMVMESGN